MDMELTTVTLLLVAQLLSLVILDIQVVALLHVRLMETGTSLRLQYAILLVRLKNGL